MRLAALVLLLVLAGCSQPPVSPSIEKSNAAGGDTVTANEIVTQTPTANAWVSASYALPAPLDAWAGGVRLLSSDPLDCWINRTWEARAAGSENLYVALYAVDNQDAVAVLLAGGGSVHAQAMGFEVGDESPTPGLFGFSLSSRTRIDPKDGLSDVALHLIANRLESFTIEATCHGNVTISWHGTRSAVLWGIDSVGPSVRLDGVGSVTRGDSANFDAAPANATAYWGSRGGAGNLVLQTPGGQVEWDLADGGAVQALALDAGTHFISLDRASEAGAAEDFFWFAIAAFPQVPSLADLE